MIVDERVDGIKHNFPDESKEGAERSDWIETRVFWRKAALNVCAIQSLVKIQIHRKTVELNVWVTTGDWVAPGQSRSRFIYFFSPLSLSLQVKSKHAATVSIVTLLSASE